MTCHNVGGDDGAGDLKHNIFQVGDGVNRSSGLPRNPPAVLGLGLRQRIGEEMTADLQLVLHSLIPGQTKALISKGISFGSITRSLAGTVDFAGVTGVDTDLVVKPFGWKGREATLRRFIEGGFRVHYGMQTASSLFKHCASPNVNTFGNGPDCQDPDGDGVKNEITEGQLTAEAVYMGLLQTPVRVPAVTAAAQVRVNQGESLFNAIGCASCHRQNMKIDMPIHVERADTFGFPDVTLNLETDTKDPHPHGVPMTVELWSDFKRHKMGPALADSKNFNQIAADQFITPPLWGVRDSAPYLHDGRAATLLDSVLMHGEGDDVLSVNAFKALSADDQSKIIEFMNSLGREEDQIAGKVDLSNFIVKQTGSEIDRFLPPGTLVPHGGFVVFVRNATQAQFAAFYGKTLGPNVLFFTGGNAFPIIDGSETFGLFDLQGVFIDGQSIPEPASGGQMFQRTNCGTAAPLTTSWMVLASSPASATPGTGLLSTGQNRICVSEVVDSPNSNFEYVELFVE